MKVISQWEMALLVGVDFELMLLDLLQEFCTRIGTDGFLLFLKFDNLYEADGSYAHKQSNPMVYTCRVGHTYFFKMSLVYYPSNGSAFK